MEEVTEFDHIEKVKTENSKKFSSSVLPEKVDLKYISKEHVFNDGTPESMGRNHSLNPPLFLFKASSKYVASNARVSVVKLFPIGFKKASKLLLASLFLLALNHFPAAAWTLRTAAKNGSSGYSLKGNSPEVSLQSSLII